MEAGLVKKVLEAALLAAREPMTPLELRKMFDEDLSTDVLRKLLDELREEWAERPVELIQLASGWRFRTRAEFCLISNVSTRKSHRDTLAPCLKLWPSSPTVSR
ncbi:MAG: SMC-Scp complex subunit ScpB [Betaproteobacteria bacterium]|nr:SMC-Scp complex subunit ScpB [Betaproteobacteria bacterium]